MLNKFKNIDTFAKNIIIVFTGTTLVNFFNLLYQLLAAHKLSPSGFAAFNSLLALFTIATSPLNTIQMALAKYISEFNARNQVAKIKFLVSGITKKLLFLAIFTFFIFWLSSGRITALLKIQPLSCGYILAALFASAVIAALFVGTAQGLELFGWFSWASVLGGVSKLILAFVLLAWGYNIAGALGALLVSNLIVIALLYFPVRRFIGARLAKEELDYKGMFFYLFPIAISTFCFTVLVSSDMVLVKYFFMPEDSGLYSLAQMGGKIFLFLPTAINIVMFPKTSGLNARNMDTFLTLNKSIKYALVLGVAAILFYNLFPGLVLKILTGKIYPESIFLGRLFSVSMSFFALSNILILYFLSIRDLRFLKYLAILTILQNLAIIFLHSSLFQVQIIICLSSGLVFLSHLFLAYKRK